MLAVRDVVVVLGGVRALDGLSLDLVPGRRTLILGPNGAGKSTLLTIAAAQLLPTRGSVQILGEELGSVDITELRTRIGWSSALLASEIPPEESVLNVVLTGAYAVTGRSREQYDVMDAGRAAQLVNEWGLGDLAAPPVGTLSEGERKRCLVARAQMSNPELLILDEPAAGLDLAGREQLVAGLSRLARDAGAPAILLVTHHVEEIPNDFTHLLLLRDGQVTARGPIIETLSQDALSQAFGMRIQLHQADGRFFASQRRY